MRYVFTKPKTNDFSRIQGVFSSYNTLIDLNNLMHYFVLKFNKYNRAVIKLTNEPKSAPPRISFGKCTPI